MRSASVSLLLFLFSLSPTNSFEVTHQIRPNSNFEITSLNHSCSTISGAHFSTNCNPALFPLSSGEGVQFSLIGKSDGDSIDNGRDLIFDPITEDLIRRLFQEKNFNSFTFNSDLKFKTSLFEISYSPFYLLADLYIFNPSFPEISIQLVNRESLRATAGWKLVDFLQRDFSLYLGTSLFYYEHQYENTVFSLFDLSFQNPEDLIKLKTKNGVAADLGLYIPNQYRILPDLAFQVKNINSDVDVNDKLASSAFSQSSLFLFETYSIMAIGKSLSSALGRFDINLEVPFTDFYNTPYTEQSMLGLRYHLRLLSVFLGLGQYYQNLGLRFDSKNFNVGISFAREQDIGDFQSTVEQSVYTGIDFTL